MKKIWTSRKFVLFTVSLILAGCAAGGLVASCLNDIIATLIMTFVTFPFIAFTFIAFLAFYLED